MALILSAGNGGKDQIFAGLESLGLNRADVLKIGGSVDDAALALTVEGFELLGAKQKS